MQRLTVESNGAVSEIGDSEEFHKDYDLGKAEGHYDLDGELDDGASKTRKGQVCG